MYTVLRYEHENLKVAISTNPKNRLFYISYGFKYQNYHIRPVIILVNVRLDSNTDSKSYN